MKYIWRRMPGRRGLHAGLGHVLFQTWSYAEGRAQSFYLWTPNWTFHVVVLRKPKS